MNSLPQHLIIPENITPQSLEKYLANILELDRLEIRQWIINEQITVNGKPYKPRRYIQAGQNIKIQPPTLKVHSAEPQDLPLDIIYQDQDLIVVAKPGNMATHPSPGWWKGSCINALLYQIKDWPGIKGIAGPGIVHRLDKDTSGLMLFAKTKSAQLKLLEQIKNQQVKRVYLACVEGSLRGQNTIDLPLGRDPENPYIETVLSSGKAAITHYQVLQTHADKSLLKLTLETGRTHQIRVHMRHIGHPVWGDKLYGVPRSFMALHSHYLEFMHPLTHQVLSFKVSPPDEWNLLNLKRL